MDRTTARRGCAPSVGLGRARQGDRCCAAPLPDFGFLHPPPRTDAWTPAVLEQRQAFILGLAVSCWQLHERAPA